MKPCILLTVSDFLIATPVPIPEMLGFNLFERGNRKKKKEMAATSVPVLPGWYTGRYTNAITTLSSSTTTLTTSTTAVTLTDHFIMSRRKKYYDNRDVIYSLLEKMISQEDNWTGPSGSKVDTD